MNEQRQKMDRKNKHGQRKIAKNLEVEPWPVALDGVNRFERYMINTRT